MAKKIAKYVTWKQAMAWGWAPASAVIVYTSRVTGCIHRSGNRICRLPYWLMRMYEMRGRLDEVVDPRMIRMVGDKKYEIGMPPVPKCRRCNRETWDRTISGVCRARKLCVITENK